MVEASQASEQILLDGFEQRLIVDAVLPQERVPKMAVMDDGNWNPSYSDDPAPRIDPVDSLYDLALPGFLQVLDE
jgi:hypothetical protein